MSCVALVIDTSYLLELYKVPDYFDQTRAKEIIERFDWAIKNKSRLYVPFSVVFEVANHIVDVRDGKHRKQLADDFIQTVRSSVKMGNPWIVTPAASGGTDVLLQLSELLDLCESYRREFAVQRIGLSDTALISEARRLKRKYASMNYRVHIWTLDRVLKAHEPDAEADALVK